jgi:hypothetical protein
MLARCGRMRKLPYKSMRKMVSGRKCQLAQLSGESP